MNALDCTAEVQVSWQSDVHGCAAEPQHSLKGAYLPSYSQAPTAYILKPKRRVPAGHT